MIAPGLRIGKYELGERIGKGGFGVVHVARDHELDRDVAIKLLRPEFLLRAQVVQRFLQEARAAARIGHPGIVTVFECGHVANTGTRTDGTAYIAMELLRGESLVERGRLPPGAAVEIGRQLAAALAAAHVAGIVHRDLKPDNIFLVPDPAVRGGVRVKLLDFGVAKLVDGDIHTNSATLLGTPRYMSPEQCRSSAAVDHRSDIYMLGCILFELVTGRAPFSGDLGDLIVRHQTQPPPRARTIEPMVSEPLDALIARMLAKSPDDRPQTMVEVAEALDACSTDEPIRASAAHAALPAEPTTVMPEELPTTVAPSLATRRRAWIVAGAIAVAAGIALFLATRPRAGEEHREVAAIVVDAPKIDAPIPRASPATAPPIDAPLPDAPDEIIEVEPPPAKLVTTLPPSMRAHSARTAKPATTAAPSPPPAAPPADCEEVEVVIRKAEQQFSSGFATQALNTLETALHCNPDTRLYRTAGLYACRSKNTRAARRYFALVDGKFREAMIMACQQEGISLP